MAKDHESAMGTVMIVGLVGGGIGSWLGWKLAARFTDDTALKLISGFGGFLVGTVATSVLLGTPLYKKVWRLPR